MEREIKVHARLDHPHIIKYIGHFKSASTMFIVLDYAENGNLYSLLHKKKKFSEPDAFIFFYQTALALNYLHQNDIVHRDLKVIFYLFILIIDIEEKMKRKMRLAYLFSLFLWRKGKLLI